MAAGRDLWIKRRRPNIMPAGAEKAPSLHEEEHAADTFTPCACNSWMDSSMVRMECPLVNTVSGHFPQFRFVMVARAAFRRRFLRR